MSTEKCTAYFNKHPNLTNKKYIDAFVSIGLTKQQAKTTLMALTQSLNENIELCVGTKVIDHDDHEGIVVKICDGTIWVWQSMRINYGSDNCEHYCLDSWRSFLRVIV